MSERLARLLHNMTGTAEFQAFSLRIGHPPRAVVHDQLVALDTPAVSAAEVEELIARFVPHEYRTDLDRRGFISVPLPAMQSVLHIDRKPEGYELWALPAVDTSC